MSSRIEVKLPSDMSCLGVPDAVLMELGSDLDCCRKALEELSTAVIEACTNAMEHGNQLAEDRMIEIFFQFRDLEVTVTVIDQGPGFDHRNWQPSNELMRERGRGILIMREFTDRLEFGRHQDGRFQVTLVKTLDPQLEED